jgi:hypothetical protein
VKSNENLTLSSQHEVECGHVCGKISDFIKIMLPDENTASALTGSW